MSKRSVVFVEIPAASRETSANFYADLFGWDFQHFGEPTNYTTFQAGNTNGGYPEIGDNYKSGDVIVYIASEDIEADLKRIEQAGARWCRPRWRSRVLAGSPCSPIPQATRWRCGRANPVSGGSVAR